MTKCVDLGGEYFEIEQKEFLKNNKQFLRKSQKSGYFPTAPHIKHFL